MPNAIDYIMAERHRQLEKGFDAAHDDQHKDGELARAAACYAAAHAPERVHAGTENLWPWEAKDWRPTHPVHNLVRACALLIAEIERIQRLRSTPEGEAEYRRAMRGGRPTARTYPPYLAGDAPREEGRDDNDGR